MKYIILILLNAFLINLSFAQDGYENYHASASFILQSKESVPAERLNGLIVISKLNNVYTFSVQVENRQVILKPSQVQFILNSMEINKAVQNPVIRFFKSEKQVRMSDYNFINHFFNDIKEDSLMYAGPNGGGGGVLGRQTVSYQNTNPNTQWQIAGTVESIESNWATLYETSKEKSAFHMLLIVINP